MDEDFDALYGFREAAWACNGHAREFVTSNRSVRIFSTDEYCAMSQASGSVRELELDVSALEKCSDRWTSAYHNHNCTTKPMTAIKLARANRLEPIVVGQLSYATAHEAAIGMVEHVLEIYRAAQAYDDRDYLVDLAHRLEDVELRDLYGHIECEYWSAFHYLSETESQVTADSIRKGTGSSRGMPLSEVVDRLERKVSLGEPYTSQERLAADLGCSKANVNEAIQSSAKLREWFTQGKRSKRRQTSLNDVMRDTVPQTTERSPDAIVPDEDVEKILDRLVREAPESKRAAARDALGQMDPEQRRRVAEAVADDPNLDDIIWPIK
jgi:hypothetical protein